MVMEKNTVKNFFKTPTVLNMFIELKEIMDKELMEIRKMMYVQMRILIKVYKETNRNSRAKSTMTKVKISLEEFNIRQRKESLNFKIGRLKLSKVKDRKEKRILRSKQSLRNLLDTIQQTYIHIMGAPEGEKREKGVKEIFEELMLENFPNLMKCMNLQIQES